MTDKGKISGKITGLIVLLVAFAILIYLQYRLRYFTWDDSYITFRHALNMTRGFGPVYNPGELADGITNYFLALILAGSIKCGIDPLYAAKLLGIISAWGTLFLTWHFARIRMQLSPLFAGITAICLASSGMFAVESVGGLETSFFTLLVLFVLWIISVAPGKEIPPAGIGLAGFLSGLAMLTRPDAAFFVFVVLVLLFDKKDLKGSLKRFVFYLVPLLIIFLPYFIRHWMIFGYPFPNSYYAKKMMTPNLLVRGSNRLTSNLLDIGAIWIVVFIAILGMIRATSHEKREKNKNKHVIFALSAFVIARWLFILLSGGPWMGWGRFLVPVLPEFYLLVVGIFHMVWRETARTVWIRAVVLLFAACIVFINWQNAGKNLLHEANPSLHLDRIHIPLGIALGDILGPNESISFGDAGALPYSGDIINIDPAGLCDRHIAHLPGEFNIKTDPEYIINRRPTVIILNSINPYPEFNPQSPIDNAMISYPRLTEEYDFILAFEAWSQYNLWLFARKDVSPYVKASLMEHPKLAHLFGGAGD